MGRKKKSETINIPIFLEVPHEYQHPKDGTILDSVTYILKRELDLYKGMPSGPGSAAQRGTTIHTICQYYDEGDLAEETVSPEFAPWFEQYKKAKEELGINVEANEIRRFHNVFRYAGCLDKIATIQTLDGRRGIIDIKTQNEISERKEHKYQLIAYELMVRHEYHGQNLALLCLYLSPNEYRLVEYENKNSLEREWIALLAAYRIKVNEGFIKRD